MNGIRTARKYIERLTDQDLMVLWEMSKEDTTHEGMVIHHLLGLEIAKRKLNKQEGKDTPTPGVPHSCAKSPKRTTNPCAKGRIVRKLQKPIAKSHIM